MKSLIVLTIFGIFLIGSCTKEDVFCINCSYERNIENFYDSEGRLEFSKELNRYIIHRASYGVSYDVCPCEFPSYFEIEENQTVAFKGYASTEDSFERKFQVLTCIKLDTIYYNGD